MPNSFTTTLSAADIAKQMVMKIFPICTYADHRNNLQNFDDEHKPYLGTQVTSAIKDHIEEQRSLQHEQYIQKLTTSVFEKQRLADEQEEQRDAKQEEADTKEETLNEQNLKIADKDILNAEKLKLENESLIELNRSLSREIDDNSLKQRKISDHILYIKNQINSMEASYQNTNQSTHNHHSIHNHNHNHSHSNHNHSHSNNNQHATHNHNHGDSHNHSTSHSHSSSYNPVNSLHTLYKNMELHNLRSSLVEYTKQSVICDETDARLRKDRLSNESKISNNKKLINSYTSNKDLLESISKELLRRKDARNKRSTARLYRTNDLSDTNRRNLEDKIRKDESEGKCEATKLAELAIGFAYPIYKETLNNALKNPDATTLSTNEKISLTNILLVLDEHEKILDKLNSTNRKLLEEKKALTLKNQINKSFSDDLIGFERALGFYPSSQESLIIENVRLEKYVTQARLAKKANLILNVLIMVSSITILLTTPITLPVSTIAFVGCLVNLIQLCIHTLLSKKEKNYAMTIESNNTKIRGYTKDIESTKGEIKDCNGIIARTELEVTAINVEIKKLEDELNNCKTHLLALQKRSAEENFELKTDYLDQTKNLGIHGIFQNPNPPASLPLPQDNLTIQLGSVVIPTPSAARV